MKRIICLLTALVLCFSLACPAFAAGNTFVPSISFKGHPEVVPTDGHIAIVCDDEGNPVGYMEDGCIVITPVSEAETSTEIPEDARQTLLDVYEALTNGTMELPYDKVDENIDPDEMVIRDIFDISLLCEEHPEMLEQGHNLVITFDLGVDEFTDVITMIYSEGQWHPAVNVVNNGDGTVTLTLDRVGVIAFSVPAGTSTPPVQTGDDAGSNMVLWVALMVASAAAVVVLAVSRRKAVR